MNSAPILPSHLSKKAVIYIRQSTGHQVMSNQESQLMQRSMKEHALRLGWPESLIQIVEADTGTSAQSTLFRTGYKNLLSELALGEIGIVLSYESTRLSRNCSDWYPLLDLCTLNRCLIGDRDGVYDPSTPNGRLLLGMKGMVSELELHTLRGRLNAGIDNKARRGELAFKLPIGYVRLDDGAIVKDPDLQIQESIALVFKTFLELRTCSKVARHLQAHGLLLPARSLIGQRLRFDPPSPQAVLRMLRTPTYAGAYVFGRTRYLPRTDPKRPGFQAHHLPQSEWRVVLKQHFDGYICWDTFERIQAILANNYAHRRRRPSPGVARKGNALLAGICYCGHCGRQMAMRYARTAHYVCRCIGEAGDKTLHHESFRSDLVDPCVKESFFAALLPVELDLYEATYRRTLEQQHEVVAAQERQLQRLRYEVHRAQRQYDLADPENRLVAQELERRWEAALKALSQAQERYEQDQRQMRVEAHKRIPLELRTQFAQVGQALPDLWPRLAMATRKELLRCLVDKVVLKRLPAQDRLQVRMIWRGGAYTDKEIGVPLPWRRIQADASALAERVMDLVEQGHSDPQIAEQLTAQGFRSYGTHVLYERTVARIRCAQDKARGLDPRKRPPRRPGGALTVGRLAALLGVHRQWIYHRIQWGQIKLDLAPGQKRYLFPGDSKTLERLRQFRDGLLLNIDLTTEHQDA